MGTCGYFWNEVLLQRETGMLCPENPSRYTRLQTEDLCKEVPKLKPFSFTTRGKEILSPVHTAEYIEEVEQAFIKKRRVLDSGDTRVTKDIFEQALLSACAGCDALDKIFQNELEHAFCAVRPPGHHANAIRALGFCIFNNVGIAARYAQQRYGIDRVLIVDWDVHPGNGTQEIFWTDPTVFTLSFHGEGLFGVSGQARHTGEEAGQGFNLNVPLAHGTNGDTYKTIFHQQLHAVAQSFQPELLIIAAGFDAHKNDPSKVLILTEEDYYNLTLIALRCTAPFTRSRTLSILEGGYNPTALCDSVIAHCRGLCDYNS